MDPKQMEDMFSQFVDEYQTKFFEMLFRFETKAKPVHDKWVREDGNGHGLSCVVQDGDFFEKAGVNVSRITIPLNLGVAQQMKGRKKSQAMDQIDLNQIEKYQIYANGVSLVIHPINPFCPTVHANFRMMKIIEKDSKQVIDQWYGGGCDLTPIYLFPEDAKLYHTKVRDACIKAAGEQQGLELYQKHKKECDEYFVNHHRKEARGIGGVFYDDFNLNTKEEGMNYSKNIAYANLEAYEQILQQRRGLPYTDEHIRWKQYRRGRYVEFNLIHDRGTKFGLQTPDARIESILMSLPLLARWEYNYQVQEGSEEEKLVEVLRHPVNWCD